MKKTAKWVLSFLVFLAVGLCIFSVVSNIFRKKVGGRSDMIHSFYSLEENSVDVLCLGSSHGYCSIQANLLWGEYGIPSYVMCSHRQTIVQSYYLLQEALKYQKPKVLLIEGYYFWYDGMYTDESAFRFAFDSLKFSPLKIEIIETMLSDVPFKERLSYYLPFLKYHTRWDELENTDFNSDEFLKGSFMNYTVDPQQEPDLPEEKAELPDIFYEYFEKIIALCEENNIEIMVYTAPYTYENESTKEKWEVFQGMNHTLADYLEEREIPFLFYQKNNTPEIDYQTDFMDYSHLNYFGAEKLTRHLGSVLTEKFTLEDRRENAEYQSWNEDYQTYLDVVEKELQEK